MERRLMQTTKTILHFIERKFADSKESDKKYCFIEKLMTNIQAILKRSVPEFIENLESMFLTLHAKSKLSSTLEKIISK